MRAISTFVQCIIAVCALAVVQANGQPPQKRSEPTRLSVGLGFMVANPKEEFRSNVSNGLGGGGGVMYRIDRSGLLSVRLDGAGLVYGNETKRVPLSETIGARILVDVNTTNSIAGFSFGPELAMPKGPVRPYLNVGFSPLFFRTTSSVEGTRTFDDEIASTTNFKDFTGSWVYGAGLRIPLSKHIARPSIDVGVRYFRGGEASYLREGSIQDNANGAITITPLHSRTPYVVYTFGIHFRIPYTSNTPCPRFLC